MIARKDDLEDRAETLEQLEAFYKEGSNQQKNYQDGKAICQWYTQNCSLQDLSRLAPIVEQITAIISMDMPFQKMNELANLVFQASTAKEAILKEKLQRTKKKLEADRDTVSKELAAALKIDITDEQKDRLQDKADEIVDQYKGWVGTLSIQTSNMDSYVTASTNTVNSFRRFIAEVVNAGGDDKIHTTSVRVLDCVPAVNRKVSSVDDVERVVDAIRNKLLEELENYDEIDLR